MNWFLEPLRYPFMHTALLAAVLVGLTCALAGTYVVLRRMAFIGDALSHAVLPGLVVAYLLGGSLLGGALVAAVATAVGIGWASRRERVREDSAIGILYTGMFALGIVLMNRSHSYRHLSHMLFGDILGVTPRDLLVLLAVAVIVGGVVLALHKELELTSFDPQHAEVIGLKAGRLRYLLLVLLALTVVAGVQAVGVVLTCALLVTPAAAAALLTERLKTMMALAAVFAVGSCVAGLFASYQFRLSSGATIVLACVGCFLLARLARAWHRWCRSGFL
jgi:manganese/iron transport system permease protein